jgi:hypothetical protein
MWERWKSHRIEGFEAPAMAMVEAVQKQAIESKAAIMSDNAADPLKFVDPAFCGFSRRGAWNYGTGSNGRRGGS